MNPITEALRYFQRAPLVDLDTPHEPSARPELRALRCADEAPRSGRPGVGGPAAPLSPGAAGIHPSRWPTDWATDLDFLRGQLANAAEVLAEAIGFVDVMREAADHIDSR